MKKVNKYILLVAGVLLIISSCQKRITPAKSDLGLVKGFDSAAYDEIFVEGTRLKLMGNNSEALKYFEQCVKLNPQSDASYYQMAQIVSAAGNTKSAKKYIQKALDIDKDNVWYLMMISGMYYQEKNIDSAIIYYKKAADFYPDNENIQLALGRLYSEDGEYEKANAIFDSLDKEYGVNEISTVSAIRNLMAQKKYDEALIKIKLLLKQAPDEVLYNGLLAEIYRGQGENEKAFGVYHKLIDENPDNGQVQLSLCDFLLEMKKYDDFYILLDKIILNGTISREEKLALFARLIDVPDLIMDKNDKLAIALILLETTYNQDDIIPLLRSDLLIRQGKIPDAALRLEDLIKERPGDYPAWEKLLLVYLQMGDYKKLTLKGEECATRFNMSYLAKVLYANGALETGKYSVALDELKKAQILAGNNIDSIVQVLTMKADVYYRMKDYNKSFETFEEALKYNEDDLTVMNNYAYYLAEQNLKLKEAEKMAKKVIETEKNNSTFLDTYGWILYKRGKLNEAAKIMESIINKGDKADAEYYEHYGFILMKQKKCQKAIENWKIALKLDSTKVHLIKDIENCGK